MTGSSQVTEQHFFKMYQKEFGFQEELEGRAPARKCQQSSKGVMKVLMVPVKTAKKSELERPYEIITANVFE